MKKCMKRLCALLSLVLCAGMTAPALAYAGFDDVAEDAWYAGSVRWAVENQITSGTSASTFSPDETCTVGQTVTFLWRAKGSPDPEKTFSDNKTNDFNYILWAYVHGMLGDTSLPGSPSESDPDTKVSQAINVVTGLTNGQEGVNPFTDVTEEDYYYRPALWCARQDLETGTKFNGEAPCTRKTVIVYLWKLAGRPEPQAVTTYFDDVPDSSDAVKAVCWAAEQGITAGTGEKTFSPNDICTRAQIMTFLHKAL